MKFSDMSKDYDDILDQNVDEVKKKIRELDAPDYEELLEAEEDGRDRKTIKEFLNDQLEEAKEATEEVVEEIEEETEGGFLGSFDREKVLAGGVIAGIVIGLLVGLAYTGDSGSAEAAENSVKQILEVQGADAEIIGSEKVSGVYRVRFNITRTNPLTNQTRETTQSIFVSEDGKYLFQGRKVSEIIQAAQQARNRTQSAPQ